MFNRNDEKLNNNYIIPDSVLSDLCSRFIINVPEEERNDLIRVFFQIEIAHWFYLDFYCDSTATSSDGSGCSSSSYSSSSATSSSDDADREEDECNLVRQQKPTQSLDLKPCSIRTFAENIFRYCPFLMQHSNNVNDILSQWKVFKHAVPTNGAIILDETMRHVLLVQGFWAKASWGFPKGKIIEEESEARCAQREVLEETGYDISDKLVDDRYLQININDQTIRLYIVTGVSRSVHFEPRTRREIKEVKWFPIDELPVHRKDNRTKHRLGYSANSFFMVIPFVKMLKQFIAIQNGTLSAQLTNGSIVNYANSTQKVSKMRNAITPTPVKHKRHNSHSYSHNNNNVQQPPQQSHHHNHHHHHHHQHGNNSHNHYNGNNFGNNNLDQGQYVRRSNNNNNNNNSTLLNDSHCKLLSKSNENVSNTSSSYSNQQQQQNYHASNPNSNCKLNFQGNHQKKQQQQQFNLKSPQTTSSATVAATSNTNAFLKHFTTGFANSSFYKSNQVDSNNNSVELTPNNSSTIMTPHRSNTTPSFKQNQQQYYNNNIRYSESDFKENVSSSAGKARMQQQQQQQGQLGGSNSKFKPIMNGSNNVNKKFKQVVNNKQQQVASPQQSLSNNNNNVVKQQNSSFNNNNGLNDSSPATNDLNKCSLVAANNNNNNRAKKHLEFNGPECWINFKFDYDSIAQSLPPLIQL